MKEYNDTLLNLIEGDEGKTCKVCEESKSGTLFMPRENTCKECGRVVKCLKKKEAGKPHNPSTLFSLMPGYKFCKYCNDIHEESFFRGRRGCVIRSAKDAKNKQEKNRIKNLQATDCSKIYQKCYICEKTKNGLDFNKNKTTSNGLARECRDCSRAKHKKYLNDPTKKKLYKDRWTKWMENNKERAAAVNAAWQHRNPDKVKATMGRFLEKNKNCTRFKLRSRFTNLIRYGLRNCVASDSATRIFKTLDYTIKELKDHIEKQFTDGMTWELYNSGEIHIDHIVPHSSFVYFSEDDLEFKECWSLNNLRPMWKKDNFKKNDIMLDGSKVRGRHIRKQKLKNLSELDDISSYGSICKITEEDTLS